MIKDDENDDVFIAKRRSLSLSLSLKRGKKRVFSPLAALEFSPSLLSVSLLLSALSPRCSLSLSLSLSLCLSVCLFFCASKIFLLFFFCEAQFFLVVFFGCFFRPCFYWSVGCVVSKEQRKKKVLDGTYLTSITKYTSRLLLRLFIHRIHKRYHVRFIISDTRSFFPKVFLFASETAPEEIFLLFFLILVEEKKVNRCVKVMANNNNSNNNNESRYGACWPGTTTPTPEELAFELRNGNVKKISLLGSTGSIGTQTLDIVEEHPDKLSRGVRAGRNIELAAKQIEKFQPQMVSVQDGKDIEKLKETLKASGYNGPMPELVYGNDGMSP